MGAKWKAWDTRSRVVHGALAAWWAASWIDLVVTQRYSTHYFAVSSVPTALMGAMLIGHLAGLIIKRREIRRSAVAWPLAAILLMAYLSGPSHLTDAIHRTLNPSEIHLEFGGQNEARAVLDLVSEPGDPLLGWTNNAWPYLVYDRVSATRFIWKYPLIGEVYLGETSAAYILPQTWPWFFEDIAESNPVALAEINSTIAVDTPFATYAADNFERVYAAGTTTISLRKDIAKAVLGMGAEAPWPNGFTELAETKWLLGGNAALFDADGGDPMADLLTLWPDSCVRIEGFLH